MKRLALISLAALCAFSLFWSICQFVLYNADQDAIEAQKETDKVAGEWIDREALRDAESIAAVRNGSREWVNARMEEWK